MRQARPTTYALMSRCELADAAKVMTLAERKGVTVSAYVAQLIHNAVARTKPSAKAEAWAAERLAANTARREKVDAKVHAGCDRKPGWENTKRFRDRVAAAEEAR